MEVTEPTYDSLCFWLFHLPFSLLWPPYHLLGSRVGQFVLLLFLALRGAPPPGHPLSAGRGCFGLLREGHASGRLA